MDMLDVISASVVDNAKIQGRTLKWVAEQMDINYKTFMGKIKRNSFSAYELLKLSVILKIDLEALKNKCSIKLKGDKRRIPSNTIRYLRMSDHKRSELTKELIDYIKELKDANYSNTEIIEELLEKYSNIELVDIFVSSNYTLTVLPERQDENYLDEFDKSSRILIMEKKGEYRMDYKDRKVLIKRLNAKIQTSLPSASKDDDDDEVLIPNEIPGESRVEGLFFDDEVLPEIIEVI